MAKQTKHMKKRGEKHKEERGPLGTGMAEHARKSIRDRHKVIARHVDQATGRNDDD